MAHIMRSLWLLCFLSLGSLVLCDDDYNADEIESQYTAAFRDANFSDTYVAAAEPRLAINDYCQIQCQFPTTSPPKNVHELSPPYVDVVAAMGDSVTAGMAASAKTILGIITDYRGVSWSIGGDDSLQSGIITLPNILRQFNPNVKGFSVKTGKKDSPNAKLNVAMSGDTASGLVYQAERLVDKMKDEMGVTDEDWKVITIWIGANDLCDRNMKTTCTRTAEINSEIYVNEVEMALDYLQEKVTRAFVNLVMPIDVTELLKVKGTTCELSNIVGCNCARQNRELVSESATLYNKKLKALIEEDGKYDKDENFTIVLQPFFSKSVIPPDQETNFRSYLSPDCFHFNTQGHRLIAIYLWNNMFEAVGKKTESVDFDNLDDTNCKCPENTDNPFFATAKNSPSFVKSVGSNEQGLAHSNPLAISLGVGMGVVFIAIVAVVVSVGVIVQRRKRDARDRSERIHLIFSKN